MATKHANPFVDDDADMTDNELNDRLSAAVNEVPFEEQTSSSELVSEWSDVSYDRVAARLLQDNFVLTALEFHTELVECGREIPRLRDFFSNPANFERARLNESSPTGLPRTSSVQTFDSLDFARYSDDGDRQENDRVAVLEFELRKAQETIKSLRASLTQTAETELSSPDSPLGAAEHLAEDEPIRVYEKRALNFLVNEFLLINDYKLSSVTFAEENEDQDFEDWDDVGLNIPKPPDILHLYRDYGQHESEGVETVDVACMTMNVGETDRAEEDTVTSTEELSKQIAVLEDQIKVLSSENDFLVQQLSSMERDAQTVRRLKMNSSTPAVSPISTPSKGLQVAGNVDAVTTHFTTRDKDSEEELLPTSQDRLHEGDVTNTDGGQQDNMTVNCLAADTEPAGHDCASVVMENGSSVSDADDCRPVTPPPLQQYTCSRKMPATFQAKLLQLAFQVPHDNRIVTEVCQSWSANQEQPVIFMLGRCLPHIVPNVLLAKREELIPLIICTATLHNDAKQRDILLNILFNLIKRPDHDQRHMILTGCVAFAQHAGTSRVESELLPQCWEQIGHKYAERRQLVAEACGALAPYLSSELRGSLVLSMLQQMMCEERDEEVRGAIIRSLGVLVGFIEDPDKYSQASQLLFSVLIDSADKVMSAVQQVFLPAMAMWAAELNKLQSHLVQALLDKLKELLSECVSNTESQTAGMVPSNPQRFCLYIHTLQQLVPVLFASVVSQGPFAHKSLVASDMDSITLSSRLPAVTSSLMDLAVIIGGADRLASTLILYEEHISAEWYEPWDALNWLSGHFVPEILSLLNQLDVSSPTIVHMMGQLVRNLCLTFGRTFTISKIKPKFQCVLRIPDESIDRKVLSEQTALTKSTVPVYVSGILGAFGSDEDMADLTSFLQELLYTLALCQAPLTSLKAAFSELASEVKFHEVLLGILWDGVVHTSANIRSASANVFELLVISVEEALVSTRIVPALVTLASDPEIAVRISTIPAFGSILETVTDRTILDKVHLQLQSFMDDPLYRDQHTLIVEFIRTLARVGPKSEPKFRDEFVLPRLAILAANNNHISNETRKLDVAMQLFEAYSALSCCFISDQLLQEAMLPGLYCLQNDLMRVAPDHVDVLASIIKEMEDKVESSKMSTGSLSVVNASSPGDMKAKMLNRFKDVRDFPKIFGGTKK